MTDVVIRVHSIECDADECRAVADDVVGGTAPEARRAIARDGWTRREGRDLCPVHSR